MALAAQILLLFSICFISVISNEYVPVNIWGMSKSSSPLPALGRINEEFFRDILLDKLNKDKVVLVFLEENLSPEDLSTSDSTGNNIYKHLSHLRKEVHMNYYPFVEGPLKAVQHLPGVKVTTVSVTEDGLPDGTDIEPGQVLIVDLNDAKENEGRTQMLKRHDSIIDSIYKSFAKKFKSHLVTMYTAKHSSWVVPSELDETNHGRKARHLMEATPTATPNANPNSILINTTTTMIYVSNIITITSDKTTNFTKCAKSAADSNDTVLILNCDVNGTPTDDALKLTFGEKLGYWYLNSIYNPEKNITFKVNNVFAPYKFSYHCDKSKYTYEDASDASKSVYYTLSLPGLQMQRYQNGSGSASAFNYAYDCVGFTTAPIWSGIFVTFILGLIMMFGLCMILDIKTMDRFDDPKGKTISINVAE